MKKIYYLFFLAFLSAPLAAQTSDKIDPTLLEEIQHKPNEQHAFYIHLVDQVNSDSLYESWSARNVPSEERAAVLLPLLKQKAAATQPALLARLKQLAAEYDAASLQALWITNAVFLRGSAALIYEVSNWPEVDGVYAEVRAEADGHVSAAPAAAPSPDGREVGLTAIGAPFMWNLGYTGYGRRAVIVDSGQDWDHPALANSFYGLYTPDMHHAWAVDNREPAYACDHGTHVAGTVLGLDRLENDTIGVAFNARWMGVPLQLGDDCNEYPYNIPSAASMFQWAIDPDDNNATNDVPDVINNSWHGTAYQNCAGTGVFSAAVKNLENLGCAVVWSAGNDGPNASTVIGYQRLNYALVKAFSTGAVDARDGNWPIADFSSRGPTACSGTGSLKIKPEVSAPGVQVRSSIPGRAYEAYDGTSMATPHASGAVLLLKEAFPQATGEQILLALYNTAIDLGAPGEDNAYGMGMISLPAAYQYLIGTTGLTPAPPLAPAVDVLMAGVEFDELQCGNAITATVHFENAGSTPLTEVTFAGTVDGGGTPWSISETWTGTLQPGQRAEIELNIASCPTCVDGLPLDKYVVLGELQLPVGQVDGRPLNNRTRFAVELAADHPYVVTTVGQTAAVACTNGSVLLESTYDGPGEVAWYDSPTSATPLYVGNPFHTPELTSNKTFYRDLVFQHLGMVTPTDQVFTPISANDSMVFDALTHIKIKQITVYTASGGTVLLDFCNAAGNCTQKGKLLAAGKNEWIVNVDIPEGEGYYIKRKGGANIAYSTTGVDFPYIYDGVLILESSSLPGDAYPWLYDMEIELVPNCSRYPVEVSVTPGTPPSADFSVPDTIYLSQGGDVQPFDVSSGDATSWHWDFGDGATATGAQVEHTYSQPGTYTIALQVENAEGCFDAASQQVVVLTTVSTVERPIATEPLRIFPNPASTSFTLQLPTVAAGAVDVRLFDALGRQVLHQAGGPAANQLVIDVRHLPGGWYRVVAQDEKQTWVGRVVK
jgi:hypothetical protein